MQLCADDRSSRCPVPPQTRNLLAIGFDCPCEHFEVEKTELRGKQTKLEGARIVEMTYRTDHRKKRLAAVAFQEEVADQGKAAVEGQEQKSFQEVRAVLEPFVDHVGFRFFCGDDRADVLDEIDAAFFALSGRSLAISAGRALETKSGVAARTKPGDIAGVGAAFWASVGGGRFRFGRGRRGPGNFRGGFSGRLRCGRRRRVGRLGCCGRL
jgi:hypothetical protein